jgi:hypothetical protein
MAYEIKGKRPWFAAKLKKAVAEDDVVAAITTAGETTIPAGTLQEVLQAIADLADPEAEG